MFGLILRYPFAAVVILLGLIVSASLLGGSLMGLVTWGDPARMESLDDLLSPRSASPVDKAFPATPTVSHWTPRPAPDFTLVDQDGQTVTLSGLRGKVILVNFIFTQCQESCPQITHELRGLQEHFETRMGRDVLFLSITLDPEHDRPKVLKAYGQKHGLDFTTWHMLTGSPEKIDAVRSGFGVHAEKVKTKTGHLDILHTAKAYAVDRNGLIVEMLQPGMLSLFGAAAIDRILEASNG